MIHEQLQREPAEGDTVFLTGASGFVGSHILRALLATGYHVRALVRPGGIVAFHDVAKNYDDTEVKRLWDEIKSGFEHREYALHPRGFYGIGVIEK